MGSLQASLPAACQSAPEGEGKCEQGSKVAKVNVSPALTSACSLPDSHQEATPGLGALLEWEEEGHPPDSQGLQVPKQMQLRPTLVREWAA